MATRLTGPWDEVTDTDAKFRAWGKGLSDDLVAVGMVLTADTGQINWTTVAKPAGSNTYQGYEIFRFNDTLQSSKPIIFRIDYGWSGSANQSAIKITVGTATDGAGTLTGLKTEVGTIASSAGSCTAEYTRTVGAANHICQFRRTPSQTGYFYSFAFGIERTHDANGNDTPEGFNFWWYYQYNVYHVAFNFVGGQIIKVGGSQCLLPKTGVGSTGTQTMVFPVFPVRGVFGNPLLDYVLLFQANCTAGVPFTLTLLGASHTYLPLLNASSNGIYDGVPMNAAMPGVCIAMRWE